MRAKNRNYFGQRSSATDFAAAHGMDLVRLSREELFWPVLAIGSNAGPEQLRRKYPLQDFPDCVIPVVQVALEDFDVVYAPYIATYGSCTATLEHSPGTVTYIFITYLTGPLMERMHATEGGYNLCRLLGLRLHVAPWSADGNVQRENNQMRNADDKTCAKEGLQVAFRSFEIRDWVYQYNHKLGCIKLPFKELGGSPVAIAAIPAERRTFPAASQVQMLTTLMTALDKTHEGPLSPLPAFGDVCEKISSKALDDWLLHLIKNSTARSAICKRLSLHAQMFFYPNCEVIADM
ncbi:hypothetical protein Vretimale_16334 [Volvox reticuliferus]|uniref:Uncharacterized protein n=1 Tax=Volvox reticuliferus TaxID=1737510 RepID=A0A8J4LWN1_9CHLO|nr:hypothetical protein Vretifemale_17924 [Volvox reticuliferus]GIM13135.1 hypothetical protein Vretimale_16334 [Volvox reticuliferus]